MNENNRYRQEFGEELIRHGEKGIWRYDVFSDNTLRNYFVANNGEENPYTDAEGKCMGMRIVLNDTLQLAEIWLTRGEQEAAETKERLQALYCEYRAKKYMPVVFFSGKDDLLQQTSELLCLNQRRSAEKETQIRKVTG